LKIFAPGFTGDTYQNLCVEKTNHSYYRYRIPDAAKWRVSPNWFCEAPKGRVSPVRGCILITPGETGGKYLTTDWEPQRGAIIWLTDYHPRIAEVTKGASQSQLVLRSPSGASMPRRGNMLVERNDQQ
jgi:hypothetical protein